ncbi:hypothetical protein LY78DRAFT_325532 [Colletotrichum sublineola]|nr:hypothetical protein LY78DRAFT_325532 [Colletotrichum sublineola]
MEYTVEDRRKAPLPAPRRGARNKQVDRRTHLNRRRETVTERRPGDETSLLFLARLLDTTHSVRSNCAARPTIACLLDSLATLFESGSVERAPRKPYFLFPVPKPSSASSQVPKNIPCPPTETPRNDIQRERGQGWKINKPTHEQHPPGRLSLSHVGSRTHAPPTDDYAVESSQGALWNGWMAGKPGAAHWFQSL